MLGAVAGANAAVVLAEGHVADVMQPIFDAPMSPVVGQKLWGIGLVARERRHAVNDFGGPGPLTGLRMRQEAFARDAKDLFHARPAKLLLQERIQFGGGLDGAVFAAAVALVPLLVKAPFSPPLPLLAGGKTPLPEREIRWKSRPAVSAGSLSPGSHSARRNR